MEITVERKDISMRLQRLQRGFEGRAFCFQFHFVHAVSGDATHAYATYTASKTGSRNNLLKERHINAVPRANIWIWHSDCLFYATCQAFKRLVNADELRGPVNQRVLRVFTKPTDVGHRSDYMPDDFPPLSAGGK